jgi:glycogen operon protein
VEPELRHESLSQLLRKGKKAWHGVKLNQPDWGPSSHSLALTSEMEVTGGSLLLHVMFNAYWEPLDFELPPLDKKCGPFWRRSIDTALDPPHDIADWQSAPAVRGQTYKVEAHSVVVLIGNPTMP